MVLVISRKSHVPQNNSIGASRSIQLPRPSQNIISLSITDHNTTGDISNTEIDEGLTEATARINAEKNNSKQHKSLISSALLRQAKT